MFGDYGFRRAWDGLFRSSPAGLTRGSTEMRRNWGRIVDGRAKPGQDEERKWLDLALLRSLERLLLQPPVH